MNDKLATINDLAPIARSIRDRQEAIEGKLRQWNGLTADLIGDAADQGRDILLAKTKLGKAVKFSEWLHAHVPNLSEAQAGKYERIATEQLNDPRQCVFAFLPPNEPKQLEDAKPKAPEWQRAWGNLFQFTKTLDTVRTWPVEQVELTKDQLSKAATALGGRVVW